jgi:hypothetical protein
VERAVKALLSRSHAKVAGLEGKFGVRDLGDEYQVRALDSSRSYTDESRDCGKRAEVAAVFVALTLAPPDIQGPESEQDEEPPPESDVDPPAKVPAPTPAAPSVKSVTQTTAPEQSVDAGRAARALSLELELGGLAAVAPHSDGVQAALGGELGLSAMKGRWGLKALVGLESSVGFELDGVALREERVPVAILLRRVFGSGSLRAVGELGPSAHFFRVRQSQQGPESSVGLAQFGARGSALLRLDRALSPYASILLEYLPGARPLALEPRGPFGDTASLWLGASVGLVAKLP